MVMGTSVLGLLGCIVGATAKSINTLIGANLLNGIAAAGQLSFGIVLGELVPNKHRGPIVTLVFLSSLPFAGKSSMSAIYLFGKAVCSYHSSLRSHHRSSFHPEHRSRVALVILLGYHSFRHYGYPIPIPLPPTNLRPTARPGQDQVAAVQGTRLCWYLPLHRRHHRLPYWLVMGRNHLSLEERRRHLRTSLGCIDADRFRPL